MPFICLRRADIPNSTLQVTDFWPNKSQANAVIDPYPQGPRYVSQPATPVLVTLSSTGGTQRFFGTAESGLSAYLLANVQVGLNGPALTPAQGLTAANDLVAAMRTGAVLNLAAIDAILTAAAGGATLTGNLSTGSVTDVLRILSGATYTVPAGTVIQTIAPATDFVPQGSPAAFNAANFDFNTYVDVNVADSSFYISLAQGKLNGFTSSSFSYKGTTGAALVVYDNAGAVI